MGVQVLQWFERVEPHQRTLKLRTAKRAADPLEYQWREADLPDLTWRTGTDLQPRTSTQRLVARWQLRGSVFVRVCICACAYLDLRWVCAVALRCSLLGGSRQLLCADLIRCRMAAC